MKLMRCLVLASLASLALLAVSCQPTQAAAPAGPITLTLWNIASEQEDKTVNHVIDLWNTAHPDIKVVRESNDVESYKLKLKTAIAANETPDLFMSWGAGFSKPFVDSGKVLQLDDLIKPETKTAALKGALNYATYDGKLYGLPFGQWAGILLVNNELFTKYNVKVPTSWDELITAVKTFRKAKIGALGVGVSESWTAMFYHNILALRAAGAQQCNDALAKKLPFNGPDFLLGAQKLKELVDLKAFADGSMGMNYDEMNTQFKQGKIPMMFQGPWYTGMLEAADSPVKGKIDAIAFPTIPGGKGTATEMLGGSVDLYMVAQNSKHPKEAVQALEFITRELSKEMFEGGSNLPCYTDTFDTTKIDRLTLQVVELMKKSDSYVLAWDTFLEGKDAQTLLDLSQEMFAGKVTAQQFVDKLQTVQTAPAAATTK